METYITLIKREVTGHDEYENEIIEEVRNEVQVREISITRSEFYQAAQSRLNISHIFVLSNYIDYNGEEVLEYTDRFGKTAKYRILKTYRRDSDEIEITCGEAIEP